MTYFERPGRRNILSDVYQRALDTPADRADSSFAASGAKPKADRRRGRSWVPIAATLAVIAVVAGAVVLSGGRPAGLLDTKVEPLQSLASDAWDTALSATFGFRESASRDLSMVLERIREARGEGASDGTQELDVEDSAPPVATQSRGAAPVGAATSTSPMPDPVVSVDHVEHTEHGDDGEEVGLSDEESTSAGARGQSGPGPADGVGRLAAGALFDISEVDVTPPVTIRRKLPTLVENAPWYDEVGVVEAIVSAAGEVEKVRLVSPPESVHQAMILSAIKTWRFRPARMNGQPVRYRQLIPVAIPH